MRLIALNGIDSDGRPLNVAVFDDAARAEIEIIEQAAEEELTAEQAAARFKAEHPDAEIVEDTIGGNPSHWRKAAGEWMLDPRPAPRRSVLAYNEFEDRFTETEQDALADFVYAADPATGKPLRKALLKAYNRAVASNRVDLDAPETAAFMDALVAGEVIAGDRRAEILDGAA